MRGAKSASATVALALCITCPAHAQSVGWGRLEGTITDSVHARPLAGAHVVAVATGSRSDVPRQVTSDSAGRYQIDSLPLGRYIVGLESALLDSLEITLSPREVTVSPGRVATLDLAVPPAAKLRAAECPGVALPKETGVVYGRVVSAETESPLAGAVVVLQWRELALWDAAGGKMLHPIASARTASITTDDGGWYHACGVPTGTWVSLQVQQKGRVGPVLRTLVDDTLGIVLRHVSFSASTAHGSKDFADTTRIAPFTGTATLTGFVRGLAETPIPSAEVYVLGTRSSAVTDAQGSYTLSGLPAGTHELEVRRIGYSLEDAWVELRNDVTTRSDVRLQRSVNLDSIRVVATRTRYKEFAEHQRRSPGGRFLGPEQIQRMHASRTSDIIRSIPGFIVEDRISGRTRVYAAGMDRPCLVNIAIDGFSGWGNDPDAFSVDDVNPRYLGAIELYQGGVIGGPPELDKGCGTIVIWTKR
ncbi:MAG TPA: carboxypeptidase regulatory-like domain-containing protein [Gemmatimonadaceae bacterium]